MLLLLAAYINICKEFVLMYRGKARLRMRSQPLIRILYEQALNQPIEVRATPFPCNLLLMDGAPLAVQYQLA